MMSKHNRVVLLHPRGRKILKEWEPLIPELKSRGYKPVVVIDARHTDEWYEIFAQWQIDYVRIYDGKPPLEEPTDQPDLVEGSDKESAGEDIICSGRKLDPSGRGGKIKAILARLVPASLKRFFSAFISVIKTYFLYRKDYFRMISELHPCAAISAADNGLMRTIPIQLAHKKGVPSLIAPPLYPDSPDLRVAVQRKDARGRWSDYSMDLWWNRLLARFVPNLSHSYNGATMLFYPGGESLAMWLLGLMSPHPWHIWGGRADKVIVDSRIRLKEMIAAGAPESKLVLTGRPRLDVVYQANQSDLAGTRRKLGLSPHKMVILCSMPHLAEHNILGWDDHWTEMEFLLETFDSIKGAQALISPIPGTPEMEHYRKLAEKFNAILPDENDISVLIPLCDVFVASLNSSTTTLAIGLHRPAAALGFYGRIDLDYWIDCPGVARVYEKELLRPTLERLIHDQNHYRDMARLQAEAARDRIIIDGACSRRVVDALQDLIAAGC